MADQDIVEPDRAQVGHGGHRLTRRLLALGLSLGTELEVVQRRGRGVVVARGGNRVALGEGVAQKLLGEALG